ncbi:hypothetical protein OIDMADRAFT_36530 [Oidiodendron maius Zn]|uniref:Uncharacterized protein n=1 Tax=Oidiodendron maius (strain Zn) TaxID=913774 RepID=A0A0C3GLT1_OIDMZ|nr:hypothetical protein OIDMADRAFT_36530 [Oidiodendron maius Zn]
MAENSLCSLRNLLNKGLNSYKGTIVKTVKIIKINPALPPLPALPTNPSAALAALAAIPIVQAPAIQLTRIAVRELAALSAAQSQPPGLPPIGSRLPPLPNTGPGPCPPRRFTAAAITTTPLPGAGSAAAHTPATTGQIRWPRAAADTAGPETLSRFLEEACSLTWAKRSALIA